jgi:Ni/Co efflux regulator RcnB
LLTKSFAFHSARIGHFFSCAVASVTGGGTLKGHEMRKLILTALIAASVAIPASAMARDSDYVSRGELSRDRQDIREEYQDLRDAYRRGDRGDIREERREYRSARNEYREDRSDWRAHRRGHPENYRRGNWRSDHGYRRFDAGHRIDRGYYGSRYVISDPWRYRLPQAYGPTRWVRHHDDVMLVDLRSGEVRRVIRNFFW